MAHRVLRALAVLAGAAAALGLAGCGVPMVITAGSFAADGVSYAASGRSLTDHYISHAMEEDCALHRVFDSERNICVDPEAAEGAEDGAEPPEDGVAGEGPASGARPARTARAYGAPHSLMRRPMPSWEPAATGGTEPAAALPGAAPPPSDTPAELMFAPGGPASDAAPAPAPAGPRATDTERLADLIDRWAAGGAGAAAGRDD
jgi:hypothetical protein